MEHMLGRWLPNKPNKHPKLAVEVSLCQDANNKKGLKAPTTPGEQHTTMVTAMPDTGASMCLVGRYVTMRMGIMRHDLPATTKKLVRANGGQIEHG